MILDLDLDLDLSVETNSRFEPDSSVQKQTLKNLSKELRFSESKIVV